MVAYVLMNATAVSTQTAQYQLKGYIVANYVQALHRAGLHEQAVRRASDRAKSVLLTPPVASSWADGGAYIDLLNAVYALAGKEKYVQIMQDANRGSLSLLQPVIGGALRVFGISPLVVFKRIQMLNDAAMRGVVAQCKETSNNSCVVEYSYPSERDVGEALWTAVHLAMGDLLALSGARGQVEPPVVQRDGTNNRATFTIRW